MKAILKEPLVHFLLIGAALFVGSALLSQQEKNAAPNEIVISQGQIEHLATTFSRAWQRPPSAEELAGLVQDRVREEVYYREALAMGLDQDDAVIRRRLRQKMEFITSDLLAQAEPTEAQLSAYLHAHSDAFRVEPRFTFRQVYLNPSKRGHTLQQDAEQLQAQLRTAGGAAAIAELGDSLMLGQAFDAIPGSEIAKLFGENFAAQLPQLAVGAWQGPIESGYGLHWVWVSEGSEGRIPALAEVRDAVQREWSNAQRLEANEKFYAELLKRYSVTIENLQDGADRNVAQAP